MQVVGDATTGAVKVVLTVLFGEKLPPQEDSHRMEVNSLSSRSPCRVKLMVLSVPENTVCKLREISGSGALVFPDRKEKLKMPAVQQCWQATKLY